MSLSVPFRPMVPLLVLGIVIAFTGLSSVALAGLANALAPVPGAAWYAAIRSGGEAGAAAMTGEASAPNAGSAQPANEGRGRTALVTGASAGIGTVFAQFLAARGFDLVLVARREDRLSALADELAGSHGIKAHALKADLGHINAAAYIAADLQHRGIEVDVLVNNAGYAIPGDFAATPWNDHARFIQVMMTTPTELAHRFAPAMRNRGWGRIVNVSSMADYRPGKDGSLYSASKAYVTRMSQALHHEYEGTGVHVTAVLPGFTWSEFHDVAGNRDRVGRLPAIFWMAPEPVVAEAWRAVTRNRPKVAPGPINKVLAGLLSVLPDRVIARYLP